MFGTPRWRVEELTGYKPLTTFWEDFSIADRFGAGAVRDTFRRPSVNGSMITST